MGRDKPSHKRRASNESPRHEEALDEAIALHRSGHVDRAKLLYERILVRFPNQADALHLLGFAELQTGNFERAVDFLKAAVERRPQNAEYCNNLALAYLAAGRTDEAATCCHNAIQLGHTDGLGYFQVAAELLQRNRMAQAEAAIQLGLLHHPDAAEAYNYLGIVTASRSELETAVRHYRHAIGLQPDYLEAWNNLGNALRDTERVDEAIPCYKRAIGLDPTFAAAHNNLGVALVKRGELSEAIGHYEQAIRIQPGLFEAWNNLGNAFGDSGNLQSAIESYHRALQLAPRSAETYTNLGVILRQSGQLESATLCLRRAAMLMPTSALIHAHLASMYAEQGAIDHAAALCRHAARLDPHQPLWSLFAATLIPAVFASRLEMDTCWEKLCGEIARLSDCNLKIDMTSLELVAPACPFNLQYFDNCLRKIKEAYAELFHRGLESQNTLSRVDSMPCRQRRRIGFVVTDRHEPVFLKSMAGIIDRLSAENFEFFVFCSARGQHAIRSGISRSDIAIVPLPNKLGLIAKMIGECRCDLLYYWETGTDVTNYFLPFLRLAAVQMTSWGVQVTSGIANMDCYLSSELVEPSDAASHYSERLLLARSLLTYRSRSLLPACMPRDSFALPTNAHWYVCAQQLGKFHLDFDSLIAEILQRDDQGIVVTIGDATNVNADRFSRRFANSFPALADRIFILPRLDLSTYLSLLKHAGALLDPPHFAGVNSTYDGLSLGKPIVTLPSRFHRGRYTLGCYRKMGVSDFIASDADEYVRTAVDLASDAEYRLAAEQKVLETSSLLFEDIEAVSEHERIFRELTDRC